MKGILSLRKSAAMVTMCLAVLCLPGYSEPTPEQIAERTKLLIEAVKNDDVEWVKRCISNGAYVNARVGNGKTVLMCAISRDVADVLIKAGADVNAKDNNGMTALMVIVNKAKESHDYTKNKEKLESVAELLIKSGADVNAKDNKGWTALMNATFRTDNYKNMAELLIRAGADVNAKDNRGRSVFANATISGSNTARIVTDLLRATGATE